MSPNTSMPSQKNIGEKAKPKFRKAPQAPKRFKSAFIFFSIVKHPEIRATLSKNENNVPNVAKLVSTAWKDLSPKDRSVWIDKAVKDKKRYEIERQMYTGPWKVPALKETKKHPDAPKRPMSTFLAYSQDMRKQTQIENPGCSSTEVSKLLAVKWKQAPLEERKFYIEQELEQRNIYKIKSAAWKEKTEKALHEPRMKRQEVAQEAVMMGLTSIPTEIYLNPDVHPSREIDYRNPQNIEHPVRPNVSAAVVPDPLQDTMHGNMFYTSYLDYDYMNGEGVRRHPSNMQYQNHNRYGYHTQNTLGSSYYGARNISMSVNEQEAIHYHPETSQLIHNNNSYKEAFEHKRTSENSYFPQVHTHTAPDIRRIQPRYTRPEYTHQPQTYPDHGSSCRGTNGSSIQQNPPMSYGGIGSSNIWDIDGYCDESPYGYPVLAPENTR